MSIPPGWGNDTKVFFVFFLKGYLSFSSQNLLHIIFLVSPSSVQTIDDCGFNLVL